MKTQIWESLSFIYMVIRLIHQIDKAKRMISKLFGHCICLIMEDQRLMKISTPACINSNTTKVIDYDTFFHFALEKKVLLYSLLLTSYKSYTANPLKTEIVSAHVSCMTLISYKLFHKWPRQEPIH